MSKPETLNENADREQEGIIGTNIEVITQHFTTILALVLKCTYMAKAQLISARNKNS